MASAIRASMTSLARRWSALRSARVEAATARDFWDAGAPGEPEDRYWGSQPLVRRAINRRVTGDPNRWPMEWFAQRYAPTPLPLGLSVGCGTGLLERDVFIKGVCERIEGVDFSPEAIAEARRGAEEAGLARRLDYRVEDINAIRLPRATLRHRLLPWFPAPHPQRRGRHGGGPGGPEPGRPRLPGRVHGPLALRVERRGLGLRAQRLRRAARGGQEPGRARDPDSRWTTRPNRSARARSFRPRAGSSRSSRTGPTAATSSGSSSRAWTWPVCARTRTRALSRLIALEDHLLEQGWVESYFRVLVGRAGTRAS